MHPNKTRGTTLLRLFMMAVIGVVASAAHAAVISNLYNTGVNNAGVALPANVPDPHYTVTASPSGPFIPRTVIDTSFPFPIWAANNSGSRWIGPDANGNGPAGNYRYRTDFTLPLNVNLSTVNITGLWGTDDPSIAMRINGNLTPNVSGGFVSLTPFTINSGFQPGNNFITFDLANVISVTGLRVDEIRGTYQLIPEPGALCLAGAAIVLSVGAFHRRRHNTRSTSMSHPHRTATLVLLIITALLSTLATTPAWAHPIFGRDLTKFEQLPMDGTPVNDPNGTVQKYYGHDELSTAYGFPNTANVIPFYQGRYMADDFADNLSSPVVHVKWWGSYLNNIINPNMPVNKFLISFETDVPAGPAPSFSRPGTPIITQTVKRGAISPGSGTFTETLISPGGAPLNENLYEYNAELNLGSEFKEQKDTVYWIKIAALVDVPAGITFPAGQPPTFATRWGWHNRDYTVQDTLASPVVTPGENLQGPINGTPIWHFQDDAVTGILRYNHLDPNPQTNLLQPVTTMAPTRYIDGVDGPASLIPGAIGIGGYSKDLAFAIYTTRIIPEPTTCLLAIFGVAGVVSFRRRLILS